MPLPVYRLRRWLAATAILFTLGVAGMYFYARMRMHNVLNDVPGKIGVGIKRTAKGFQFSKSEGGRTLFTIEASDIKEFQLNGHAELHNVSIVLYGRDSSRFDQIYGDDFAYDPKTGDVTAKGEVLIDLESNPAGIKNPDQATPKEMKNPIHLKTRDLVFNRETGNASTDARVELRTPQATGWAVGVHYAGKTHVLTLSSQIHVLLAGARASEIQATRGVITNEPRQVVLEHPRMEREGATVQGERATLFLDDENNVQRVLTEGNVEMESNGVGRNRERLTARANAAEALLEGSGNQLRSMTLSGAVHVEQSGEQSLRADAGKLNLGFAGKNVLQSARASEGVRIVQLAASRETSPAEKATAKTVAQTGTGARAGKQPSGPQNFELTAPTVDFVVAGGKALERAVTSGPAQIAIYPSQPTETPAALPAQHVVMTAGKFDARFAPKSSGGSQLAAVHGEPAVRIVSTNPGQPDRISTSDTVDAMFAQVGGIESLVQQGNFTYLDDQPAEKRLQAWADRALYTPADQMLTLTGSPRVNAASTATTADTVRVNRATGEATATGSVKSTYSQLREQPNGSLLASSSPIHVTAQKMTVHNSPNVMLYSGNARLWQDANVIQAPSIEFDRDQRSVRAQGTASNPVSTILVQPEKAQPEKAQPEKNSVTAGATNGSQAAKTKKSTNSSPVTITGTRLTYADADRKAHYEGGVMAKGIDFMASAKTLDVFLVSRSQATGIQSVSGQSQLEKMVATDHVVIQQSDRRAEGEKLVYTATEDKFVLTGGPPCIFDAEQRKITGVSLTFYRADDRVLVEGEASTPVVTQTRVAR